VTGTRVAVVTGAAQGIGQATARELDRRGWSLVLLDRQAIDSTVFRDALSLVGDLTDDEFLYEAHRATGERFGGVGALVNNAGRSLIAPAMNTKMWENKATQKNVKQALENGVLMVEPKSDVLACGELGIGKMASAEEICEKVEQFFENRNLLKGKKIVITGGSTIEPIDPVRFIGNHSSGKQAIEIASTLSEMGADVTFIAGNIRENIPLQKEKIISVKTAQEMFLAVERFVGKKKSPEILRGAQDDKHKYFDVFIACAAVADFRVKNFSDKKIKKSAKQDLTILLEKNPDILEFVGHSKNRGQVVIGFAAESENLEKYAREKLQKKNCDLIVANNIEEGKIFGSNQTDAMLVFAKKSEKLGKISKNKLANILAAEICKMVNRK